MYKHVVDTPQSRVKRGMKRVQSETNMTKKEKKENGIWYFHKLLKSVFFKEVGSFPSTPNKQ